MSALNRNKFLSKAEYNALELTLTSSLEKHPRDVLMLLTLMNTGARPTELLNLRKMDLSPENNSVFIRGLKGSRDREIPLPPFLFQKLDLLAAMAPPEQHIFLIALRTLQGIWHQYRPAKKGIRSLRHTFAIRLYQRTKDVRLVQMALGHKYLNTTQIYVDYVYNQEELRKLLL